MKTKKEIIELILKLSFLSKEKKERFANVIKKNDFKEKKIDSLFKLFQNFEKSCEIVEKEKKKKTNFINKKYLKKIEKYFISKKKKILGKRKYEAKAKDKHDMSVLLRELENV